MDTSCCVDCINNDERAMGEIRGCKGGKEGKHPCRPENHPSAAART